MYFTKYLLSIEEFMNTEKEKALMERAFSCVDETRRRKAEQARTERSRAACLGAGLLLQLAVGEALEQKAGGKREKFSKNAKTSIIEQYSASQLLACTENMPRLSLNYTYGERGKPYLRDFPFYFNLSHSGDYVLCGLAAEEIGADIQQRCGKDLKKLAQRFFSQREAAAIERAGEAREKLFYRLWARKEAYGKLTGRGVADVLSVDLLPGGGRSSEKGEIAGYGLPFREAASPVGELALPQATVLPDGRCLIWEECDAEGYSIAFCRYG